MFTRHLSRRARVHRRNSWRDPPQLKFTRCEAFHSRLYQQRAASSGELTAQSILTTTQLKFFQDNGFLVVKADTNQLFSTAQRQRIFEYVDEIQRWPLEKGKHMHFFETPKGKHDFQLCRTEYYLDFHLELNNLVGNGSLPARAAAELLQDPTHSSRVFKERLNYKFPGGGGFAPHQDAPAWSGNAPTTEDAELDFMKHTLNMNIAIDHMYLANGGLEVVPFTRVNGEYPGSAQHKPRYPQNEDGTLSDELFCRKQRWEPVLLAPGDTMFFSLYIAHRSGPNLTNRPRRAVYITYGGANFMAPDERTRYYAQYRKAFPPAGEHEAEDSSKYDFGDAIYNWATPIAKHQPDAKELGMNHGCGEM